jgi:hypothetical protein
MRISGSDAVIACANGRCAPRRAATPGRFGGSNYHSNNATDHALAGLARRLQFVFAAPIEDNLAN